MNFLCEFFFALAPSFVRGSGKAGTDDQHDFNLISPRATDMRPLKALSALVLALAFQARASAFSVPSCIQSRSSGQWIQGRSSGQSTGRCSGSVCNLATIASRRDQRQTVQHAIRNDGGYYSKEYWDGMYRGEGDVRGLILPMLSMRALVAALYPEPAHTCMQPQ